MSILLAAVAGLAFLPGLAMQGARDMLPSGPWQLVSPGPEYARMEEGTGNVVRLVVLQATDPFYRIGLSKTVPAEVPPGHRVRLTFRARSATGNPLRAVVERTGPPWTAMAMLNVTLTPEWKTYAASGITLGLPPNGLSVRFQAGHEKGEVELADIHLEDEGKDPQIQAAEDAIRPEAVEERIRKYRTGTLTVRVKDAKGKAIPNAEVKVEQTRHAFLFGCNIFGLSPEDTSDLQRQYQERFAALLNYATLPFYWGSFEPQEGARQYERLEAMARWCREHGIMTKGHPLIWHEVYPRWAPSDPDKAIPLLEARVKDIIPRYRDLIPYWDVLNEATSAPRYANTGVGAWIKRDGAVEVVGRAITWAREASKGLNTVLLYNDYDTSEECLALLRGLQARKMLPDAIGIQSHMHGGTWPLTRVWAVTEEFAKFGLPLHYTETTVLSGPAPQPGGSRETTEEGERAQAEYVERFYSLLFSHPSVEAITWWDFSDLRAWQNAPAGLVRKDMSPKPAYDRLMALIKGKWWTNAAARTDRNGTCSVRAFQGSHRITVKTPDGRTKTVEAQLPLRKNTAQVVVQVP